MATRPRTSPSPEVIRYFEQKKLTPSFSYKDVWGEEHAHAFTVAKSAGFDILQDVRDAVHDAIANGETFETFKLKLEPTLRAKGWWGQKIVIDPKTGEKVRAKLGSPRRLKIIYDSNLRAARAAGQWERAQRTKAVLPFFEYNLGPSENHRPLHEAKRGLILSVDDPFWDAWYPPNGWGCKCWLRQITQKEADGKGGASDPPEVEMRTYENTRRGTTEQIPVGIDPGWQTSPGKARARGLTNRISERLQTEGEANARPVINELWQNGTAEALAQTSERIHIPVAVAARIQHALSAKGRLITISSDTVRAKMAKRKDEGNVLDITDFAAIQEIVDTGEIINEGFENRRGVVATVKGLMWYVVFGRSKDGFLFVRTIHPTGPKSIGRIKSRLAKREK